MRQKALVPIGLILLSGCLASATPAAPEQTKQTNQLAEPIELTVFAASSLTDAFDEIASQFEAEHPSADVIMNYGSSSQLATQINEGAPADVFASANEIQMSIVQEAGRIEGVQHIFATNRLVVIIPIDNPGEVESLEDLGKPGLRLVLAVPGVPVRDYADQMIAALAEAEYGAGYADAVYASVVSEEDNVRQVAAKVALGEADAGVVYASDVTPNLKDQVQQIDVPDAFNVLATYPIAIIKDSDEAELANTFIAYVLGEQGQAVLTRWGFGAAPGE